MKQGLTDISVVLDRSGSMERVRDDTIGGFNTFLKDQKEQPGEATISLFQFDDIYETVYEGKPVNEAPELDLTSYVPRGMTALQDAIGKTVNATKERLGKLEETDRPEKVLVVILTDGQENHSKEFTKDQVLETVKLQKETKNWEFIFLGADQDAITVASGFGMNVSAVYSGTKDGTAAAMRSMSNVTTSYRAGADSKSMADQLRDEVE